ncbi:MAG TPA: glycosyltransferase family 1 protein, partial [Anaerolineae bacterium]|nr:glycosyltransferase family 1 protein [Anaerolineae bacterium]
TPDYVPGRVGPQRLVVMGRQLRYFHQTLRRNRPDVAHIHLPGGTGLIKASLFVAISRWQKVPTVSHLHFWPSELRLFGSRQVERGMVRLLGWSDAIVTVSDELADYLRPLLPPQKHILVMPNCVDLAAWLSLQKSPDAGKKIQLLFVGTVGRRKGVFELVQAFADAQAGRTAELVVLGGDGGSGALARLEQLAERLGVSGHCRFPGPVYGVEKRQVFADSDLFLLPSYAEGQPVTILEAMAAGLPIISTRVGAIPDVVQDGRNGLLVEPGDVAALTHAIDNLVEDAGQRRAMGQLSRQLAAQYDVKLYVKKLLDLYAQLS